MEILNNNITMIRGDSETLTVFLKTSTGILQPFVTGDTIYFTVKNSETDTTNVIRKTITTFTDGKAIISLTPNDTNSLPISIFTYDVRLKFSDGITVKTIIEYADFKLKIGSSI